MEDKANDQRKAWIDAYAKHALGVLTNSYSCAQEIARISLDELEIDPTSNDPIQQFKEDLNDWID